MEGLRTVTSPVFPVEQDVDVSLDAEPLSQTSSIQVFIKLAEPVVFLQGFNQAQQSETPPSMLRGSLVLRVLKPSKLKNISLSFKGYSRTEWPEGIPPKKQDFVEICDIVNHVWPFYQNDGSTTTSGVPYTDDNSFLLRESGASIYQSLENVRKRSKSFSGNSSRSNSNLDVESGGGDHHSTGGRKSTASNNGGLMGGSKDVSTTSTSNRTLSPMSILRRATSPSPSKHDRPTNLISDLLSSTFSNSNEQHSRRGSASSMGGGENGNTSGTGDQFIFQPGDYVYTFEQAIPSSYPETIKADFGFVEYQLFATIERVGTFKSNITARLPVNLIRTQSDSSVEETEPIAISRDWEDQLHYDIVIASKDIILDAFLPIAFHFAPLDKVVLHRIRIYLTETMEYYCRGKKVHRMEPTRKFLLSEHNGPNLAGPDDKGPLKAKNMGNLLLDESSGDLMNKDYEYQVYVPSIVSDKHVLHPDTAFDKIKSSHWIKLSLRLSRMVNGKRKHYEISIDSPIHVLHKLCSHANTLLPSYDSHIVTNEQAINTCPKFGNTGNVNIHHGSNIFFPKEILLSPILSPEVHSMDMNLASSLRTISQKPVRNRDRRNSKVGEDLDPTFASPKLRSNIYQPETIPRELASPQAVPFSVNSPLLRTISPWVAPPSFAFDDDGVDPLKDLPPNPPTYEEALKYDDTKKEGKNLLTPKAAEVPKITLSNLNEGIPTLDEQLANDYSIDPLAKPENPGAARKSLEASLKSNNKGDDGDVASSSDLQGTSTTSPNLPVSSSKSPGIHPVILGPEIKPPPRASLPTSTLSTKDPKAHSRSSFQANSVPSMMKSESSGTAGLNDFPSEEPRVSFPMNNRNDTESSTSSSVGRSSFDSLAAFANRNNMIPLLQSSDNRHNASVDDFAMQSRESIANYTEPPMDTSVDITALYDRNFNPWHPMGMSVDSELSRVVSPYFQYSSDVADTNHVIDDFKETLHCNSYHQDSGDQNTHDEENSFCLG